MGISINIIVNILFLLLKGIITILAVFILNNDPPSIDKINIDTIPIHTFIRANKDKNLKNPVDISLYIVAIKLTGIPCFSYGL